MNGFFVGLLRVIVGAIAIVAGINLIAIGVMVVNKLFEALRTIVHNMIGDGNEHASTSDRD